MSQVVLTVLFHAERILLVQEAKARVYGTWNLPGGRVEAGEGLIEAALRETQEEAGIAVALHGLMSIHQGLAFSDPSVSVTRFVFVGAPSDPREARLKTQADEHSLRAQWFELSELASLPLRNGLVRDMAELAACKPALLPLSGLRVDFRSTPGALPGARP